MSTKKKSSSEDSILLTTPPPPPLASLGRDGPKTSCKFWVESLHFFVGAKGFRDKQLSCGKKVEELRNKGRSGRLVKKLSKLDLNDPNTSKALEKELIDKCIDELHTLLTKSLKEHRTKQQKLLSTLKEKETNELMKWIYSYRKDEYRRLSKLTRDKNELGRMKREVNNGLVAKGVVEREKIEQNYGDIERGLEMEWSHLGEEAEEWCARRPPHFLSLECGSSSVVQLLKFTKN